MKKIERYTCEFCSAEYDDKSQAEECEAWHRIPSKIVKSAYHSSVTWGTSGYPDSIDVEMDDGAIKTYQRHG